MVRSAATPARSLGLVAYGRRCRLILVGSRRCVDSIGSAPQPSIAQAGDRRSAGGRLCGVGQSVLSWPPIDQVHFDFLHPTEVVDDRLENDIVRAVGILE